MAFCLKLILRRSFLQQALRMKGFDPKWCAWIQNYIAKGSVGIRVNNDIGHYFQTKKASVKVIRSHQFYST
jgi:hypothetical protein